MKTLITLFTAALFVCSAGMTFGRDIGQEEAAKLRASGIIQSTQQLEAAALTTHPGATITDSELDEEYGKHVYQVDLRDAQGIEWDVEVDATNGAILKDHQDK
ncbi:PepSY domain-containing protein [Pseudomonas sp. DSP3-2-2]|uniref:PepSY domain-containing protein n=1 Tax=unclassified Pseudomonas TaxID=196821 RepID=UPI003CF58C8C